MFVFRQALDHLRNGFHATWAFIIAAVILTALDLTTILALIWHFLLRESFPILPAVLTFGSTIYLAIVVALAILAFGFGRLRSVQAAVLFYASVGLFFLLSGMLGSSGQEFTAWPWIIVWVVILSVVVSAFSREFQGQNETPQS